MSSEIQNENDLLSFIKDNIHLIHSTRDTICPKVTRIAGNIISPEIDLLVIHKTEKEETITGYEFKFLKHKANAVNYRRFHEGIGQAVLYFQYGIDTSYLFLGISKNISLENERGIRHKTVQMERIRKEGLRNLGIIIWHEKDPYRISTPVKPEGTFPYYSYDDFKLNRQNVLMGNFNYDEKFLMTKRKW